MFRDLEHLQVYTVTEPMEERCLVSWRRPIVLLRQRSRLASGINPGMHTLGCMLSYMPIHYDWFARTGIPALVMTSGNLSDLPIAITPEDAEAQLAGKVAILLHHNRPIHNRVDDSVLQVCGGQPCLIRRSRGYVPEPFFTDTNVEGIMAFGAEKVNTFALGKGETILQSQYIGDLKNWETFRFYTESMERFRHLFRFNPQRLVCDLHPDYLSSQEAERISKSLSLPLLKVVMMVRFGEASSSFVTERNTVAFPILSMSRYREATRRLRSHGEWLSPICGIISRTNRRVFLIRPISWNA